MRYIYIEFLGEENGVKHHLVFDKISQQETTINHIQLVSDGNDQFDWTATFARMGGGGHDSTLP
jgi:hypothetical protein